MQPGLQDSFGRRFSYLRLSVTDACNFRCVYCLPNGYKRASDAQEPLTLPEINHLVTAFAEMGTVKLRLTGGEPTLRKDFLEIVQTVARVPGIRELAISTNGFRLKTLARPFRESGVTALNVSIDTLDRQKFAEITGADQLPVILEGIEAALAAGFPEIKVNAVLMNGWNEEALESFLDWIRDKPIAVRFIELMPTGDNQKLFTERHIPSTHLTQRLTLMGWALRARGANDGPAAEYTHPQYRGRIGVIAPYAKDFCASCNRLRVTSQGALRLCLFGEGGHPLRDLLQSADQKDQLKIRLNELLHKKEISHYLPEGRYGNNHTFSAMGG